MYKLRIVRRTLMITIALIMILTSFIFQPVQAQTEIYEKVNPDDVVTGTYVMVASNGYAPTYIEGTSNAWILSTKIYETPEVPETLENVSNDVLWKLDLDNDGVKLTDSKGESIAPSGGDANGIKAGIYRWLLVDNGNGTVSFEGQGADTVALACNKSQNNKLRAYKKSTIIGGQTTYPSKFSLYRLREEAVGGYAKIHGNALVSGTYVMVLSNGYMPTVYTNSWIYSRHLSIYPSITSSLNPTSIQADSIWTLELSSQSKARLKDSQGAYIAPKNGDNNLLIQSKFDWDVVTNDDGTISFSAPDSNPPVTLAANMTANQTYTGHFRAYRNSTIALSLNTYPTQFTLYQVSSSIDQEESPQVCIYEVYGGGGNKDAIWKDDYVILKNTTDQAIPLDDWHLYYASVDGDFSNTTNMQTALSGEIAANSYFVIKQKATGTFGGIKDLPRVDLTGNIAMSAESFKLALVNDSNAPLSSNDSDIIDFLGVGGAKDYWGSGTAPTLSDITSLQRISYTKNNATDYKVVAADGNNLDYLTPIDPPPELEDLKFTESPSEPWSQGDPELVFKLNADSKDLSRVAVNGVELDEADYSIEDGSTIIRLPSSYLQGLDPGVYDLVVTFSKGDQVAGGIAETEFEIAASKDQPDSGPPVTDTSDETLPSITDPEDPIDPSETAPSPMPTDPETTGPVPTVTIPSDSGKDDPKSTDLDAIQTGESTNHLFYAGFFFLSGAIVLVISLATIRKRSKIRE